MSKISSSSFSRLCSMQLYIHHCSWLHFTHSIYSMLNHMSNFSTPPLLHLILKNVLDSYFKQSHIDKTSRNNSSVLVITTLVTFQANIIFSGDVVGRQCLSVKICSCPKRDKEREEGDVPLSGAWSTLDTCTKSKKKSYDSKYISKRARLENNHQMVIYISGIFIFSYLKSQ